jgi:hypothetical protein
MDALGCRQHYRKAEFQLVSVHPGHNHKRITRKRSAMKFFIATGIWVNFGLVICSTQPAAKDHEKEPVNRVVIQLGNGVGAFRPDEV